MTHWNCPTCGGLVKHDVHPDGLIIAKAIGKTGCCLFCEEPLPPRIGKPRMICKEPGCKTAYQAAYLRDYRFAKRAHEFARKIARGRDAA